MQNGEDADSSEFSQYEQLEGAGRHLETLRYIQCIKDSI